jgi:hypothetical protein
MTFLVSENWVYIPKTTRCPDDPVAEGKVIQGHSVL